MFETSLVRAGAIAVPRRATVLTLSLAAHTAVIVGAVAISIASVDFPANAPDEYRDAPVFAQVRIPPPLGTRDGGAKPSAPLPARPPAPQPSEITAPRDVPEDVAQVPAELSTGPRAGENPSGTHSGPLGVEWGTRDSIGDLDAPPATGTLPPVEEKIYQPGGEVTAPVLIHRVEPVYPQLMVRSRMATTVAVRCVIDKSGRVRDPQIITGSSQLFNQSVLTALQQWRYKPGTLRGQSVETYLDLTVRFSLK